MMNFREWLDFTYYVGFDVSGLSDEQFWALEDDYNEYCRDYRAELRRAKFRELRR